MLSQLSTKIGQSTSVRKTWLFFALFVLNIIVFVLVGNYATHYLNKDVPVVPLDEHLYSVETVYTTIQSYQPAVINLHIWLTLTADITFPIIYGLFFAFLISNLLKALSFYKYLIINLLPIFGAIADYPENFINVYLLAVYPTRLEVLANVMIFFKILKFIGFFGAVLAILLLGLIWLLGKFGLNSRK